MAWSKLQDIRETSGFQFKERGVSADSGAVNGSNKDFIMEFFPLVDANEDDSVAVADVKAYVGGTEVTVASIVAASGKISLQIAPAQGTTVTFDYDWSSIDDTDVTEARQEAENHIEGYLSDRYTLPPGETIPMLKNLAKRLAAAILLEKEYGTAGGRGQEAKEKRKEIEKELVNIRDGKVRLIKADGTILGETSAVEPEHSNVYDADYNRTGILFDVGDENFSFADPTAVPKGLSPDEGTGEDKDWY